MGSDTVLEVLILGVVGLVLLYGISWWRGRRSAFTTGSQGSLFRLVNQKVSGLFSVKQK